MKPNERGIALVITLFLMATLSALAVSMMFLAQTETAASRNYRTMSQARYSAEAGVHEMANYLMYTQYVPTSNYDASKQPVTCTSGCSHNTAGTCTPTTIATAVSTGCIVVGYSAATSNNPDTRSNTAATGTLAMNASGTTTNAALGTATYGAAAILMAMKTVNIYGGGTGTVQTWQIISDGTVPPSTAAIVEVSSTLEQEVGYATTYAVFATNALCGAITISGNASTDSYNSTSLTNGAAWSGGSVGSGSPVTTASGGGIGTNGNLNVSGSVAIGGTLSTPRTGAGACSNSNVDAITGSGSWSYGGTHQLSQSVSYPTPTIPSGIPTSSVTLSANLASCTAALVGTGWSCSVSGSKLTLTPSSTGTNTLTLGNVSIAANTDVVIAGRNSAAGPPAISGITDTTILVNSFSIGNNATLSLADGSQSATMPKANVVMEIAGQSLGSANPLDLSGGGSVNTNSGITGTSGFDPSRFQILYAGTAQINMVGNNSIAATVYAPNAAVRTTGHGNLYGSVLASTFTDTGGAKINYDSNLNSKFSTLGNFMLTSFSWKKY